MFWNEACVWKGHGRGRRRRFMWIKLREWSTILGVLGLAFFHHHHFFTHWVFGGVQPWFRASVPVFALCFALCHWWLHRVTIGYITLNRPVLVLDDSRRNLIGCMKRIPTSFCEVTFAHTKTPANCPNPHSNCYTCLVDSEIFTTKKK